MDALSQIVFDLLTTAGTRVRNGRRVGRAEAALLDEVERLGQMAEVLRLGLAGQGAAAAGSRGECEAELAAAEAELLRLTRSAERQGFWRLLGDIDEVRKRLRLLREELPRPPGAAGETRPVPSADADAGYPVLPHRPPGERGPAGGSRGGLALPLWLTVVVFAVAFYVAAFLQHLLLWAGIGDEADAGGLPGLGRLSAAVGGAMLGGFILSGFELTKRPAVCLPGALLGGLAGWLFAYEWLHWLFTW